MLFEQFLFKSSSHFTLKDELFLCLLFQPAQEQCPDREGGGPAVCSIIYGPAAAWNNRQ